MNLIYCASGNRRFANIALENGFQYGCRFPGTVYYEPYFTDLNWKNPDRQGYMDFLRTKQPSIATVLDWEEKSQLNEVLGWAEEASTFVKKIIIIPKVVNGTHCLPKTINGKEIVLGYSVQSNYGRTITPIWEFTSWPVHLLGGSPHRQYQLSHYFEVVSIDINMMMKMAVWKCAFWENGRWIQLHKIGRCKEKDAPYLAFEMSCQNIKNMWR